MPFKCKKISVSMLRCCLCLLVIGSVIADPFDWDDHWGNFKKLFNKMYSDVEEKTKRGIYQTNMNFVFDHNSNFDKGLFSFKLKENPFSDMTLDDLNEIFFGYGGEMEAAESPKRVFSVPKNMTYPATVDWRREGYVTPVKNQGHCKSCWAFASVGALESQYMKKTGNLIDFSEQNLIDCLKPEDDDKCNHGLTSNAYVYIKNKGINSEKIYPLQPKPGKCKFDANHVVVKSDGYVLIPKGDEEALKHAVSTVGPIAVAIDAKRRSFMLYGGGVYDDDDCKSDSLNHAVIVVGYGTDEHGKDFWIVRNSWGSKWGLDGYILMARNKNNLCGIASRATYPLI